MRKKIVAKRLALIGIGFLLIYFFQNIRTIISSIPIDQTNPRCRKKCRSNVTNAPHRCVFHNEQSNYHLLLRLWKKVRNINARGFLCPGFFIQTDFRKTDCVWASIQMRASMLALDKSAVLLLEEYLTVFPFFPTSHQHQFNRLASGFARVIMKTKDVCRGLISLHVSFHNKRTM